MGSIYKRPRKSGGYTHYADVWRAGRRKQVSLRTSNHEVAKAKLRDRELATTHSGPHTSQAVADALGYFTDIACAAKPEATRSSYGQKARHLSRLMGYVLTDDLDRTRVERYIAGVFRGVVAKIVPRFRAAHVCHLAQATRRRQRCGRRHDGPQL